LASPSKKQNIVATWWDSEDSKGFDGIIAEGSIRSGKTHAMIFGFLLWSNCKFKGSNFIVAGRTVGALKRNVVKPMLSIIRGMGWSYKYNRSEGFIEIGTNTYYLFGASTESSQDVIQGLTATGCYADEVALFPRSFVEQMVGRCSVECSKLWFNCNPSYPSHFFKTEWIDLAEEKNLLCLKFTMEDNPSLSKTIRERYERMYTGVFYDRYILGLWTQAEGLIYPNYKDALEQMFYEEPIKYCVSIDYGTQNAFHALLHAFDGNTWHVIDEYRYSGREQGHQKTDADYIQDMKEFIPACELNVIIDPSATSFCAAMRRAGYRVIEADNQVGDGLRHTATCLSCGRLKIGDNCKYLIEELAGYVWDEKKSNDVPLKENDHGCDALRYFVETEDIYDNRLPHRRAIL